MTKYLFPLLLLFVGCSKKSDPAPVNASPVVVTPPVVTTKEYSVTVAYNVTIADSSNLNLSVAFSKAGEAPIGAWIFNRHHPMARRDSLEIYHYRRTNAAPTNLYTALHLNTAPRFTAADFVGGKFVKMRVYVNGILKSTILFNSYNGHSSYYYAANQAWAVNWTEVFELDQVI